MKEVHFEWGNKTYFIRVDDRSQSPGDPPSVPLTKKIAKKLIAALSEWVSE